jgi:hypothetical protein
MGTEKMIQFTGLLLSIFESQKVIIGIAVILSSLGSLYFYQGITILHKRKSLLVGGILFFSPSLQYFMSQHLKEPYVFFFLGISFYSLIKKEKIGLLIGILGMFLFKPYISMIFLLSLVVLLASRHLFTSPTPQKKMVLLFSFLLIATALLPYTFNQRYIESIQDFETIQMRSVDGGSSTDYFSITKDYLKLPQRVFSVLFRPLPFEELRIPSILAGIENLFLLILFLLLVYTCKRPFQQKSNSKILSPLPFYYQHLVFIFQFIVVLVLIIGNLGTSFRIKTYILPFLASLILYHQLLPLSNHSTLFPPKTRQEKKNMRINST